VGTQGGIAGGKAYVQNLMHLIMSNRLGKIQGKKGPCFGTTMGKDGKSTEEFAVA